VEILGFPSHGISSSYYYPTFRKTAILCTVKDATPLDTLPPDDESTNDDDNKNAGLSAEGRKNALDLTGRRNARNYLSAAVRRSLKDLSCTATEICVSFQDSPFCLTKRTGDFHDDEGTTGSISTGDYALADGREGNVFSGPTPLPNKKASPTTERNGKDKGGESDTPPISAERSLAMSAAVAIPALFLGVVAAGLF
jgi:hypothetical protein